MKYKLIKPMNKDYNAIEQILTNRGIPYANIQHYLNTTDEDINDPAAFGSEILKAAAAQLILTISNNENAFLLVDCDCDGFTSAALLINYLYTLFPSWVENHLKYFLHEDKQHGLQDCIDYILEHDFSLVIVPDAGSNDYEQHKQLKDNNIQCIILDHHEAEKISDDAIVINNQLSNYPNKNLSGVGVTWQFCRYIDKMMNENYADNFLDLVALGDMGDMMSLQSLETKHLILKGFKDENIKNPFILGMANKNSYSLGKTITPMGAAFYIVPFVNSMVRSGTLEEKDLLFKSMLQHEAFKEIPSNKRGHKIGEMERVVDQALRTATNVKNRQTRAQDAGMESLEGLIEKNNMMEHQVLLFLLEPGKIDKNLAGLCANKLMAKYQRPCCILTRVIDENGEIIYQGSARGCDKVGITQFKDICEQTNAIEYAAGHQGAFGLGILETNIEKFIVETDRILADMPNEPLYYVDYIYNGVDVLPQNILDIASLNNLWGKDMDEAFIAIHNLKVSKDMITLMSPDKKPTLKITLPNKISLIKFGSNQEEYERFLVEGYVLIDVVGKCNINEWMGHITPQVLIEDMEILGQSRYLF